MFFALFLLPGRRPAAHLRHPSWRSSTSLPLPRQHLPHRCGCRKRRRRDRVYLASSSTVAAATSLTRLGLTRLHRNRASRPCVADWPNYQMRPDLSSSFRLDRAGPSRVWSAANTRRFRRAQLSKRRTLCAHRAGVWPGNKYRKSTKNMFAWALDGCPRAPNHGTRKR